MHSFADLRTHRLVIGAAVSVLALLTTSTPGMAADKTYAFAAVQQHASAKDCWTIVGGGVYNLTTWIPRHPGGSGVIKAMCGIDATAAFAGQHGLIGREATRLARYRIGNLAPAERPSPVSSPSAGATPTASGSATSSPAPSADPVFTGGQVASHATPTSCWTVVGASVYDVTRWISRHPGGAGVIKTLCGANGTAAFAARHGSSMRATTTLKAYRIGAFSKAGKSLSVAKIRITEDGNNNDEREAEDD